jgi:chemotaxis protein methyltransferase CheR
VPPPAPPQAPPAARPVEPELDKAAAEPLLSREEAARPASFRPAPPRVQPTQVYRAGDKSDLKRLLMLKKQKSQS